MGCLNSVKNNGVIAPFITPTELIIKEMPSPTLLLLKCSMDCDIMRENN